MIRWVSTTAPRHSPRQGKKSSLYVAPTSPPAVSASELVNVTRRRILKAERDERMDITNALTLPKTYEGGFTRPRDFRTLMWFPGGPYTSRSKGYEQPPTSAYVSHTVFLLESRYMIKFGIGRVDGHDHILGCCLEGDLEAVLQKYNSERAPNEALQSMDNARWPWQPHKPVKRVKWWDPGQSRAEIIKDLFGDVDPSYLKDSSRFSEDSDPDEAQGADAGKFSDSQSREPISKTPKAENKLSLDEEKEVIRSKYLPTLTETPFWRPLLTLTVSTRPLALTLLRLSTSLRRGLPFYASMSNDDRKSLLSFSTRMRCLRINRMTQLALELAELLAGARGGLVGVRFAPEDRGRGMNGEGLADPIPWEKRVIHIGVGNWYYRAEEVKEVVRLDAAENVPPISIRKGMERDEGPFEIYGLDDFGRRFDEKGQKIPWAKSAVWELSPVYSELKSYQRELNRPLETKIFEHQIQGKLDAQGAARAEMELRRDMKIKIEKLSEEHRRTLALDMAQGNKNVIKP